MELGMGSTAHGAVQHSHRRVASGDGAGVPGGRKTGRYSVGTAGHDGQCEFCRAGCWQAGASHLKPRLPRKAISLARHTLPLRVPAANMWAATSAEREVNGSTGHAARRRASSRWAAWGPTEGPLSFLPSLPACCQLCRLTAAVDFGEGFIGSQHVQHPRLLPRRHQGRQLAICRRAPGSSNSSSKVSKLQAGKDATRAKLKGCGSCHCNAAAAMR